MRALITQRVILYSVLLVLISTGTSSFLMYNHAEKALLDSSQKIIYEKINNKIEGLTKQIHNLESDVLFVSWLPPIQGILRAYTANGFDQQGNSSLQQWQHQLNSLFKSTLKMNPGFSQVRYLHKSGAELVRANRHGQYIEIVTEVDLQTKQNKRYIKEALKLGVNEVYLSKIELNREHGEVITPFEPVLRAVTPVFDSSGDVFGVVVINLNVEQLFNNLKKAFTRNQQQLLIANAKGEFLLHPSEQKQFGFDKGEKHLIQDEFQFDLSDTELNSKQVDFSLILGDKLVFLEKIVIKARYGERTLFVAVEQDYKTITENVTLALWEAVVGIIVITVVVVLLSIIVSRRMVRPLKQMVVAINTYKHDKAYVTRLPVDRADEIGVLARSFKSLIDEIVQSHTELEYVNQLLKLELDKTANLLQFQQDDQQTILDTIAEGIVIIKNEGIIERFNHAAEKMFGYKEVELVGKNVSILMPKQERCEHEAYTQRSNLHAPRVINKARDLTGLHKDGSTFSMELNVSPLKGSVRGFVGILRDISERKQYELELVAAKDEAETASSAKSQFLASMSHELRTPLNAILGFSQLLDFDKSLNADQRENVQEIHIAGKHLLQLINEVLDLVKIESNQLKISIEAINISELLDEVIPLSTPLAQQRNITISCVNQAESSMVLADHLRLKQVFINLLSNATKYNRQGGRIDIEVTKNSSQGKVKISIADSGYGISDDKIKYVFEPFNRLGAEVGKIEGTGIGLVITRKLIEAMGGSIGFKTEVDKGSVFWVELPVNNGEAIYTVLYVEDNPASQRLMKQVLSSNKEYQLIVVGTAEEGLEITFSQAPDLIFMDINLPGIDGLEAMKRIRQNSSCKNIPIVAVSANAMEQDIDKGIQAGFDDYLSKPVNTGLLLQAIEKLLPRKIDS